MGPERVGFGTMKSSIKNVPDEVVRRLQELSPTQLLAEVHSLGLRTRAESANVIRVDRDRTLRRGDRHGTA
jgi:hypothetical protein